MAPIFWYEMIDEPSFLYQYVFFSGFNFTKYLPSLFLGQAPGRCIFLYCCEKWGAFILIKLKIPEINFRFI